VDGELVRMEKGVRLFYKSKDYDESEIVLDESSHHSEEGG
jgi:hypothetical protein